MLIVLLVSNGVVAKVSEFHLNLEVVVAKDNARETASDSMSHEYSASFFNV